MVAKKVLIGWVYKALINQFKYSNHPLLSCKLFLVDLFAGDLTSETSRYYGDTGKTCQLNEK